MPNSPIQAVQSAYAAFGRGDIPAFLENLSPRIAWEHWADNSAQAAGVPWLEGGSGLASVRAFVDCLQRELVLHDLQVLDIFGSGRQVAAEIRIDAQCKATGTRFTDEELHLWTFDDEGKVSRFRHYVDTLKHARAAGLIETAKPVAARG